MQTYNILVTIDNNYLQPLKVMLQSLVDNNPGHHFQIYLLYSDITEENLTNLGNFCETHTATLVPCFIDGSAFAEAPISDRYSQTMYYRLLAHQFLPASIDKILYLDPDILIINSINALYQTDLTGYIAAACIHTQLTPLQDQVNKIRLNTYEADGYYNSGVLMINLEAWRNQVIATHIFDYIKSHGLLLLLPDQDVLNGLYGKHILSVDDALYNYDARNYETYRLLDTERTMTWVIRNTVVLHFCGRNKPWKKDAFLDRFTILYKHYEQRMLTGK